MNRRLKNIIAAAALAVVASTPAVLTTGAQTTQEGTTPAGQSTRKPVTTSCPTHPEIKARSAGKCPKCRMEERKRRSAQEKKDKRAKAEEGTPVQSEEGTPVDEQ